ncbi:hypothetical protein ACROYT_G013681 [Oculina patagonica]
MGRPDTESQTGGIPENVKIALIVIGTILLLVLICLVIIWYYRTKKQRRAYLQTGTNDGRSVSGGFSQADFHQEKTRGGRTRESKL